jgi:tetratricopeptide (TPR) repeat protein
MQGRSLLGLAEGAAEPERPVYAETDYPRRGFGWSALASWRVDRFLFVQAPRRELYDTVADPGELHDLAPARSALADRLAAQLAEFRARSSPGAVPRASTAVDPALAERLAALGYVSGGTRTPAGGGADPKDRISVSNALHDAILAIEDGQLAKALPLLERVVRSDPQIPTAQLQLGIARCRERQYAQAIAPLRRAIELQPDAVMAHYEMGIALFETGDWKTAAGHFEIVAAKMPKFADARFSLGSVYARIDRVSEAVGELQAALELEPRHYRANLLLGRIHTLQGQAAAGVPYLQKAAEAQPSSVEAQAFLADAYQALGRVAEAAQARARAQQLRRP